jgi:RNA polymerase sigma factor (sigma-70 family)
MVDQATLARLLSLIAGGDEAALASFYKLTSGAIFFRIKTILRDRTLAEDAVQEIYVSVWRYARRFDPAVGSPSAWLGAIAKNQAVRFIRTQRAPLLEEDTAALDDLMDPSPSPLEHAVASAEIRALKNCLDQLDGAARSALLLAFYGSHSYADVARLMGEPEGTVKSRIRRALARLKRCLEQ